MSTPETHLPSGALPRPMPVFGDGGDSCCLLHDPRCRILLRQTRTVIAEWCIRTGRMYLSPEAKQFSFAAALEGHPVGCVFRECDVHAEDWPQVSALYGNVLAQDAELTLRLRRTDGHYLWCRVMLSRLTDGDGLLTGVLVTINNVHEAVAAQRVLAYRAEYDSLTGYANFPCFKETVAARLADGLDSPYALLYCDLKNFKYINDIYGYETGDHVLQYWADTLAAGCGEGEAFARVSADNFVLLLHCDGCDALSARFYAIERRLAEFEELQSQKFRLEMACGVYWIKSPADVRGIDDMIDRANMAQKTVKGLGGSRIAFYSEEMRGRVIREKSMEADMEHALAAHEFVLYLQAQVDIQQGCRVVGAEALVRWQRPGEGLIPPGDFIPLFEQDGFIVDLDRYVFQEACAYLAARRDAGQPLFKIAVNVSRLSLFQEDFVERYTQIRDRYGLPAGLLELECTETVMVENITKIGQVAAQLRETGFLLGMDDFGSGYSSLNVLKDLFVDVLKLDMAFFENGLTAERNRAIVSSIVAMAKILGMRVVAEGVEVPEMVSFLREIGCDMVQGYVFARPVPIGEFRPDASYTL
ncbi:EAL domain-containing protein [Intestinibacillus massiliensis]|nr:EAL domain-containing protein [Intestinibacillus massiliensis]